jgi:hypothetical protein
MRVDVEDLAGVLFGMFQQSGCDPTSAEFMDRAASIEIVNADEDEVVEALHELRGMIQRAVRRH